MIPAVSAGGGEEFLIFDEQYEDKELVIKQMELLRKTVEEYDFDYDLLLQVLPSMKRV